MTFTPLFFKRKVDPKTGKFIPRESSLDKQLAEYQSSLFTLTLTDSKGKTWLEPTDQKNTSSRRSAPHRTRRSTKRRSRKIDSSREMKGNTAVSSNTHLVKSSAFSETQEKQYEKFFDKIKKWQHCNAQKLIQHFYECFRDNALGDDKKTKQLSFDLQEEFSIHLRLAETLEEFSVLCDCYKALIKKLPDTIKTLYNITLITDQEFEDLNITWTCLNEHGNTEDSRELQEAYLAEYEDSFRLT